MCASTRVMLDRLRGREVAFSSGGVIATGNNHHPPFVKNDTSTCWSKSQSLNPNSFDVGWRGFKATDAPPRRGRAPTWPSDVEPSLFLLLSHLEDYFTRNSEISARERGGGVSLPCPQHLKVYTSVEPFRDKALSLLSSHHVLQDDRLL
jgi:hypothetical protein